MAKTDRQTDKAVWWSVTAFGDEIAILEDTSKYPPIVRKVHGGREMCPTTGKEHFQGAIQCTTQVRMSALKQWLPTAHFEAARQKDALLKYAMKEDTATGEKLERTNPVKYYTPEELLTEIAYSMVEYADDMKYRGEEGAKRYFNEAICLLLINDAKLTGQLMNPSLRNFWVITHTVWLLRAKQRKQEEEDALDGGSVIEHVGP